MNKFYVKCLLLVISFLPFMSGLMAQNTPVSSPEESLQPIPLVEPPQLLKDESGAPEVDLINPFATGSERNAEESEPMGGLQRTTLGEVSGDFSLLAILVPQDKNAVPMALIRQHRDAQPLLVRPGDLIRTNDLPKNTRYQTKEALQKAKLKGNFTFYLYIKDIQPNYLEVYHNKKNPNETTIITL